MYLFLDVSVQELGKTFNYKQTSHLGSSQLLTPMENNHSLIKPENMKTTPLFHRIPKGLQCFTSFRMLKSLSILSHTQPGWHVPVVIEISAIDRYQLGIDRQHQPDAKAQPVGEDK